MPPDRKTRATPRALLDRLDAIVWEMEPDTWRFTYVSAGAERILGYPLEQWLTEADFRTAHIQPDDRDQAVARRSCAIPLASSAVSSPSRST